MELYTNQKGEDKTECNDLQVQWLVGQGLVFPQAYDALTCVWCRKQEKLFRLQSRQCFRARVTSGHRTTAESRPGELRSGVVERQASPTSDELLELFKEQQEAILGGSGDLSFNMSPWIRLQRGAAAVLCRASPRSFELRACRVSADPSAPNHQARHVTA